MEMQISRQNAYLVYRKPCVPFPTPHRLVTAAHVCNPSTWVFEAGGFKFRVIFSYMVSLRATWTT